MGFATDVYPAPGLGKLHTCICNKIKIMNSKNCRTLLFFGKYVHEHTFSVSRVREVILRNLA